jgi:hypothetical protein
MTLEPRSTTIPTKATTMPAYAPESMNKGQKWCKSKVYGASTVILEITRNCPCVVSRSQQNNSRSRFVSFPSPQCRIRAVSLGLELHVSGARRCLARGSQEHGGQRRALVVGDGVCVGGERQQRAAVASAVPASGGSEWRRWRLREEQRTGGGICGGQRVWRVVVGAAAGGGRASWLHVPCR